MARAEWLVFTDDDCLPDPDWLAAFDRNTDGRDVLEGLTRADRPQQRLDEESPINLTGGYLWSCNFAIRKNLFLHIGGFDENFPAPAMEDCDLRERLRREGIRLHFIPAAAVMHPWRKSRGWRFWQQHAIAYQYFLRKNHPHGEDTRMGRLKVFLRHAIKVLIAGNIKFRFRGFSHSALRSLWLFMRIWQRSPGEEQNP
jgi:GT2 family glycosyltransferase